MIVAIERGLQSRAETRQTRIEDMPCKPKVDWLKFYSFVQNVTRGEIRLHANPCLHIEIP